LRRLRGTIQRANEMLLFMPAMLLAKSPYHGSVGVANFSILTPHVIRRAKAPAE
jgi:hypothetical protein